MANQVSKLSYVDNKLGATMPGQQTTRVIYDTITTTAAQNFYNFFKNFANKPITETNITQNKLDSSESMVLKSIQFVCTGAGETLEAGNFEAHSILNFYVGNQCVLKDFDISFNARASTGLAFDRLHSGFVNSRNTEVRLLTDIVIPPQVNFYATLEKPAGSAAAVEAGAKITMIFKGYGKIFSAGNTF